MIRAWGVAVVAGVLALGGPPPLAAQGASPDTAGAELPPKHYGTLRQDDLSIRLVLDDIEIRCMPLDERVLRLLATDAYESLSRLVATRRSALDSVGRSAGVTNPGLMLVTFFGQKPTARYTPDDFTLIIRNQPYRPIGFVPFTANFGAGQLDVREQATGIYLFSERIPVYEGFGVSYAGNASDAWSGLLTRIERERARIMGRARREEMDSAPPR